MGVDVAWADIAAVKAEPNLERRSERAVDYANEALTQARHDYEAGEFEKFKAGVVEVEQAAELSASSLEDSGKSGRKYPKYYKKAELAVRTLLRRIENLRQEVSVDDRELVDGLKIKVDAVHDRLIADLMEKKK